MNSVNLQFYSKQANNIFGSDKTLRDVRFRNVLDVLL